MTLSYFYIFIYPLILSLSWGNIPHKWGKIRSSTLNYIQFQSIISIHGHIHICIHTHINTKTCTQKHQIINQFVFPLKQYKECGMAHITVLPELWDPKDRGSVVHCVPVCRHQCHCIVSDNIVQQVRHLQQAVTLYSGKEN